ncbi:MAG: bifunctional phosphoribosylaminoimidazolecarboxamide formyltransferase/IMP cyclohydrolase [Deltaproteobacteria bacterium]|nr:bifunctional phosphoribosylaminoimidazolecarboxamide formyltransferase/IMP cyclohydrolase [Deltaproteobacteria bacterium]
MLRRALISVYDKTDLVGFAGGLTELGVELVASGGTARALRDAGLDVTEVSALTGFPEVLGGRVKTLHPAVHAGILSRRTAADDRELGGLGVGPIDLVVVNLYPFEATVARGAAEPEVIEEIDIGGVALLRAAAKAFEHVAVVASPARYGDVLSALGGGRDLPALRRELAAEAFRLTASYDRAIAAWMTGPAAERVDLGVHERVQTLRYGENPHQSAALYRAPGGAPGFEQLGGKELSYNNLVDLDAARAIVADFPDRPTVAIVKHTNPCGLAAGASVTAAFEAALASDPVSAFGSVIAVNRPVDEAFVEILGKLFVEALVAPAFSDAALARLEATRKGCRVVRAAVAPDPAPVVKPVYGGVLVQSPDAAVVDPGAWRVVSKRRPDDAELAALAFAWRAVKHVKSNAIVLARGEATVGVGAGQMSRVDAVHLAVRRAGDRSEGAVMASDAFFPFADGVQLAAVAGVTAVVQPGGSIRDEEVVAAADAAGMAMVMTGFRHFKH